MMPLSPTEAAIAVVGIIVAAATDAGGLGVGDTLLAPAGGLVVAAGLLLQAARTYREARNVDVEGAKEQANRHKLRAEAAEAERDDAVSRLDTRIKTLEAQIDDLRERNDKDIAEERKGRDDAVSELRDLLASERRKVYRRDLMLAEHGLKPPVDED